ncbi:putative integral membrane protein [Eutypa lata UCREL1]|uniref:Putative integral membrane protein n=1 Tax=Eutypa lata (strain UCR-EL1) TaxID=1287681 RepID=M7T3G3_EUTLA|nr:putative integral membrane protein [Eutypa lata UCREL1]
MQKESMQIPGMVGSSVAFASVEIVSCGLGKGKHGWNVSLANYESIYVLVNIEAIIYCLIMFTAKYAVLQLIKSIFYDHRRKKVVVRVIWGLIWANLLLYSLVILLIIFGCKPIKKQWSPATPGHCINQADLYIPSGALNILSDLTILAVPLAAISKLQAPIKTKIAAGSLFSIGVFACMASIARLSYSLKLDLYDATWLLLPVNQWA